MVVEIAKNVRAFLGVEAGVVRGPAPNPELLLTEAQTRTRRQAAEISALQKRLSALTSGGAPGPATTQPRIPDPIRVVHVALDDGGGGAGRAAHRLNTGLRRLGHDSSMFVAGRHTEDPAVRVFEPPQDAESQRRREEQRERIQKDFARYESSRPAEALVGYGFTDDRSPHSPEPLDQLPPCDVVNLHWFGGFIDYESFFSTIPRETPVVWTVHDMQAFTGGCHYDMGCGRFAAEPGCGACPQLGSDAEEDLSRESWRRKREALAGVAEDRLHLVAVGRWLAEEIRRSSLLSRFPVETTHPSLDAQTFAPRDQAAARRELNIPEDANVVLFVADSLVTRRKGFALLAEALDGLRDVSGLFLLSLGHHDPGILRGIPHRNLGYVRDDAALSRVYSAADVYAMPSLQETFGQTVLEAIGCATPVVGFDAGGIPDMVRPGVTGELVPVGDVGALREALRSLLKDPDKRATFGAAGRRVAVEEFSHDAAAGRYADLYRSMLRPRV